MKLEEAETLVKKIHQERKQRERNKAKKEDIRRKKENDRVQEAE